MKGSKKAEYVRQNRDRNPGGNRNVAKEWSNPALQRGRESGVDPGL